MESLAEDVGELCELLSQLEIYPGDIQTIHSAEILARSVYGLLSEIRTLNDDFPWLSFIGTDGLFPKLKKIAGEKDFSNILQDVLRLLVLLLEKKPEPFKQHLSDFQVLSDSLYFMNPAAKVKVEGLKLLQFCIPGLRDQDVFDAEKVADRYFRELARTSKLSSTVSSQLRQMLARLCQFYPVRLKPLADRLLVNYIQFLKGCISSKSGTLDLTVLEGTLIGLDFLLNGGILDPEDVESLETLYEVLKKICRMPDHEAQVSRRGSMRAGLELFSAHSLLFSRIILGDVKFWFLELRKWSNSKNSDDHKIGWKSLSALFRSVREGLSGIDVSSENIPLVLQFLTDQFQTITRSKYSSHKDISLAIQGYGEFAEPLARFLSEEKYLNLCLEVLGQTEQFHIESSLEEQEKWKLQFPSHLKSIAMMISSLTAPSINLSFSLEVLSFNLVKKFPVLPHQYHGFAIQALLQVFQCTAVSDTMLDNVIYQTVIESCSHPAVGDTQILDPDVLTFKKYVPLWNGILQSGNNPSRSRILESFLRSLFLIVDKLDLTVVHDGEDEVQPEPEEQSMEISLTQSDVDAVRSDPIPRMAPVLVKRAAVVKDYTVLVNLVDICIPVLTSCQDLIKPWLPRLWYKISVWAYEHQDVSSFYKFANKLLELDPVKDIEPDTDLFTLILQFLQEHLLKSLSFDQVELRISAFNLVTNIPLKFVPGLFSLLPEVWNQIFKLSSSIPELANSALKSIHGYLETFPESELELILEKVMPNLRVYLSYQHQTLENAEIKKRRRRAPVVKRTRRNLKEPLGIAKNIEEENCQLALGILAKVSSKLKYLSLPTKEEIGSAAVVWDQQKHLLVEVSLRDVNLPLYLDLLLPITLDLVEKSVNRNTRVSAAEVLHATLLFMIGKTSQQTDDYEKKFPMTELFRRVFPVILKLCSDPDSVIQGLFQPLFSQMIHWFTKDRKCGSLETNCLLKVLLDTVCEDEDVSRKQDAAGYIQEFMVWSIKQSGSSSKNINIKSVLSRLEYLWKHPDTGKRLGGSLVFNNIYRIFREEKKLVSEHLLVILSSIFTAIKISHNDPLFCGTSSVSLQNLEHLKRILFHYLPLFQTNPGERRIPAGFSGGTLAHILDWLIDLTFLQQTEARHAAMTLYHEICRRTSTSAAQPILEKFGTINKLILRVEHALTRAEAAGSISEVPGGFPGSSGLSFNSLMEFQALFESYNWILGQNICSMDELEKIENSRMKDLTNLFIKKVYRTEEIETEGMDESGAEGKDPLSPGERRRLEKEKGCTIIRLFTFLTSVLKLEKGRNLVSAQKEFAVLLTQTMMEPEKLGFTLKSNQDEEQFVSCYIELLRAVRSSWPEYYSKLENYFTKVYQEDELFKPNHLLVGIIDGKPNMHAVKTYLHLTKHKMLISPLNGVQLLNDLLSKLPEKTLNKISPDILKNLEVFVQTIFVDESEHIASRLMEIISSDLEKDVWFIRTFSMLCHKPILLNMQMLVSKGVESGDILESVQMFVNIILSRKQPGLGEELIRHVMQHWNSVKGSINSRTDILRTIFLLRSLSKVAEFKNENAKPAVSWFCNLLKNPSIELKVKYKSFQILGLMLQCTDGDDIKDALLSFSSLHFPATSTELVPNSAAYNLYKSVFRQLLRTLESTKSPTLLYFIISIACREPCHVCEDDIQSTLSNLISRSSSDQQFKLITVPYTIFIDDSGLFSTQVRLSAVSRFAVPSVQTSLPATIRRFFSENMESLLLNVGVEVLGSEEKRASVLISKLGTFQLFGVLYSRLDKNTLHENGGIIVNQAITVFKKHSLLPPQQNGKDLAMYLLPYLGDSRRTLSGLEISSEMLRPLYRKYHCARLNCCIAIISCTNVNVNAYDKFIFSENKKKNQFIWSEIIDVSQPIHLGLVLDKEFFKRKHLVTVRQSDSSPSALDIGSQSHYLSDSSLSQDISHYDYTASLTQGETIEVRRDTPELVEPINYIEIEEDALGAHPCMAQLIAVAEHMTACNFYSTPTENFSQTTLPSWMQSIHDVLVESSTPRNVKLFMLKFIYNCSDIFLPFCINWYTPILECIVDGTLSPEGKLNYLALDLLTMTLYWSEKTGTVPTQNLVVSRMLTLIMKNVYNEEKRIFKANIEMIRLVIEKWKDCCVVSANFSVIEDLLDANQGDLSHFGALKVLAVFLGQQMFDRERLETPGLCQKICQTFTSKRKEVYQAAGVATGLYLTTLRSNQNVLDNVLKFFLKALSEMSLNSSADTRSRFIIILHGIQQSYPEILISLASKFQYSLKTLVGEDLSLCLEMMVSHASELSQHPQVLPTELNMIGLKNFLQRNDPSSQSLALQIFKKCHPALDAGVRKEYYELLKDFTSSKYTEQRKHLYEIFKDGYLDPTNTDLKSYCLEQLMVGLTDTDEGLSEFCSNFFNLEFLSSGDSLERMKNILKRMYFHEHEFALLAFLPASILSLAALSPNYSKKVFSDPLDECHFIEYHVDTNWRMQHSASLMPMYADTLSSQSQGSSQTQSSLGMLRATLATMEFSQTQAQGNLNNKSVVPNLSSNGTPVLARPGPGYRRSTTPMKVGSLVAGRRFTHEQKTAGYQKSTFSKIAERQNVRKRQLEEDQLKASEKNVTLLRRYRKGDLPDIQIAYSDLIAPILKLCKLSPELSKVLFSGVIKSLLEVNAELLNDEALEEIMEIFNNIFYNTTVISTDFIGCLIDVCIHMDPSDVLDTKKISNICLSPGLEQIGILLLEKYLIYRKDNAFAGMAKKKKVTSHDQGKVEYLIHLSDLYRTAGEHESVKGLFIQNSHEMNVHEDTKSALNFEANGNWSEALKVYKNLVENLDLQENHLKQEVDIWQKGFYQSQSKLGKWDAVQTAVSKEFSSLDQIWNVSHKSSVLQAFMSSSMHLSVIKDSNVLGYNFLNNSLKDKTKSSVLSGTCALQLAVLFGARDKLSEGLRICKGGKESKRLQIFSQNSLLSGDPISELLNLQAFCELEQYLTQLNLSNPNKYLQLWEQNAPVSSTDLNEWDNILTTRCLYNEKREKKMEDEDSNLYEKALGRCYANLALSSVYQKNALFAQRCLKKLKPLMDGDVELAQMRSSIISKVAILNFTTRSDLTAVDNFCLLFKSMNSSQLSEENRNLAVGNIHQRDINECLFTIVDKNSQLTPSILRRQMKTDHDLMWFSSKYGSVSDDNSALRSALLNQVLENYRNAAETENAFPDQGKMLLEGSTFAHRLLAAEGNSIAYGELCVSYHLKSMKAGCLAARELFPRILSLVLENDIAGKTFEDNWSTVPSWMFLPWSNQLISCLHNDDISKYFTPVVSKMSEDYPAAVLYPLRSAASNPDLSDIAMPIFQKLTAKLVVSSVHDSILQGLGLIVFPSVAISDLLKSCKELQKNFPSYWMQKAKEEYKDFKVRYLTKDPDVESVFKTLEKTFGAKLDKAFSGSKLLQDLKGIYDEADAKFRYPKFNPSQLKNFSAFLANFLASDHVETVEVPGQYTGFSRPDPTRHVTISSFEPGLNIFPSLRKPMKISMLGSDGNRYGFLVKAGEDLRQDQRIENLFEICNICLAHESSCRSKDLNIKTYKIIPLTPTLGLIEFVPNTKPLKDLVMSDRKAETEILEARNAYKVGKANTSDDIRRKYEKAVELVEKYHLKNSILKMSSSMNGFYYIRKNFITSYAVLSVMQWILGIGDRHLSNYLVCQKTGRVVTIDFGYAFGTSTSFLLIPELVQFRLTPQILAVMEPLGTHGLFRETMVQVLRCLREHPEMLISALNTFLQEPTLDWIRSANIEARFKKTKKNEEDHREEFPKQRVGMTRRKLEGVHPSIITCEELRAGVVKSDLTKLVSAVQGERLSSVGKRKDALCDDETGLCPSDQVDILIHQSTDKNLLGRMYVGWDPFA